LDGGRPGTRKGEVKDEPCLENAPKQHRYLADVWYAEKVEERLEPEGSRKVKERTEGEEVRDEDAGEFLDRRHFVVEKGGGKFGVAVGEEGNEGRSGRSNGFVGEVLPVGNRVVSVVGTRPFKDTPLTLDLRSLRPLDICESCPCLLNVEQKVELRFAFQCAAESAAALGVLVLGVHQLVRKPL